MGISYKDYLVLPARARLCISYKGDFGAEGFIGLKRLWWWLWYKVCRWIDYNHN